MRAIQEHGANDAPGWCFVQAAFNTAASLASHGGSVPAQSLLELIEWAAEVGDRKKLAFLEDELFASGKGQYLAALNSPSC